MDLMKLPVDMIENVFSFLSFDEIAKNRLVSRAFNEISMRMLTRGFTMIEKRHGMALKNVKAQLPRRESERRYHHLSRHCDILTSIETRISMLNMTYSKYIDSGFCCFIPGKVIDEIIRVLALVESTATPPRAHEVLQELRDISSMAIEHFDDKISPEFRKKLQLQSAQASVPRPSNSDTRPLPDAPISPSPHPAESSRLHKVNGPLCGRPSDSTSSAALTPIAQRMEMAHLRRRSMLNAKLSLFLASQYKNLCTERDQTKKTVALQQKIIRQLKKKQKEQDNALDEMKKRVDEFDIRHNELFHTNQAAGGKAIAANVAVEVPAPPARQSLRHFSSQIKLDLSVLPIGTSKRNNKKLPNMKPRKPVIKMPSLCEDNSEPPPKVQKREERRLSPGPSTSTAKQSPKTRSMTAAMAKIRGITNEIRSLNNLPKSLDTKLKRPLAFSGIELKGPGGKKIKLD